MLKMKHRTSIDIEDIVGGQISSFDRNICPFNLKT